MVTSHFRFFRAMPPRHLTPALIACRCRPPPLRVVAPSTDYEYLMSLGARRSCGQFITMLLVYFNSSGARRQRWMPFWPPFLAADEQVVKNKISCRIKLISLLFYQFA